MSGEPTPDRERDDLAGPDGRGGPDGPTFEHGLVIGKFYPPHAGHHALIRAAAARCRRVTVGVFASAVESIPLADRLAWLAAEHADDPSVVVVGDVDEHPIDYDDPDVWTSHVELMAAVVVRATLASGRPPAQARVDAVFSSEPYGDELARRFGTVAVAVDPDRTQVPVSATAVRADLLGSWAWLAPATRAGLALRVVVVGSESSGTTTLARDLAEGLASRGGPFAGTRWVPEYGRQLTTDKLAGRRSQRLVGTGGVVGTGGADPDTGTGTTRDPDDLTVEDLCWTHGDFLHVAETQTAWIDEATRSGSAVVVADTDALATGVWCERYLGARSSEVEAFGVAHLGDLYLLTDVDGVPFEDDGVRDGEHLRSWMQERFVERLDASGRPWHLVRGDPPTRRARALDLVGAHLANRRLADPLT